MPTAEEIAAGHAAYSPGLLRWYDFLVLGVSNRWIWRCPTSRLLELYDAHVTANHLEVGVGTGYFLDHCRFPSSPTRLVLADLNANCLDAAARRITRYHPETLLHNVFEPFPAALGRFDSIGLNYVLHCLPGERGLVFEHLRSVLNPGGVLFGSTILDAEKRTPFIAKRLMAEYNRRGIFSNSGDRVETLRAALQRHFARVETNVIGCVAAFVAHSE